MLTYVPRDANFAASNITVLPLMDRFAVFRDSSLTVLRLGLNDGVPKPGEPLSCIFHFEATFNEIFNKFRMLLITHYSVVRGCILVLAAVINRDIGVWGSGLSTFVRHEYSGTVPPGAGAVIEIFSPCLERDDVLFRVGQSATDHATLVVSPRSRPIFKTRRRHRL